MLPMTYARSQWAVPTCSITGASRWPKWHASPDLAACARIVGLWTVLLTNPNHGSVESKP